MKSILSFFGLIVVSGMVCAAEPLYVEQYRTAQPDAEALNKAEQQVREHQTVLVREKMAFPSFHRQLPALTQGEAFCQICHAPLPHSKKLRDRTFLNMHSRFIACETCHFRPETSPMEYDWLEYPNWTIAKGDPGRFRTGRPIDNALTTTRVNGGAGSSILKIVPIHQGVPAIARRDSEFARGIEPVWQESEQAEKARMKAKLHAPLKKEGPECAECHTEKQPMLNLERLGATALQATAIRRHIIPQFFSRYRNEDERLKIIDILH
ncbi:MAG: multiheme c-type cytochrome [Methylococcaceae bacterium]